MNVDGKAWPVEDHDSVIVPGGRHLISAAVYKPAVSVQDFNGEIHSAMSGKSRVDISYESRTRAIAVLNAAVSKVEIDGEPYRGGVADSGSILLPSGQHVVSFVR